MSDMRPLPEPQGHGYDQPRLPGYQSAPGYRAAPGDQLGPGYQEFDYQGPVSPVRPSRAVRQAPPARYERPGGDGTGKLRLALVIHTVADIAAAFLGLWIVLYLLGANEANVFVSFVKGVADSLAWWAQDIFTTDVEGFRVFLNYALPAVVYLGAGHGAAAWLRRF